MAQITETQIPTSPAHSISSAVSSSDSSVEKVYKCDFPECTKTYARLYSLKRHLVSHSGVKKFVCRTCGKRFALKQCLKEHSFIHTGEKPYVCPFPGCSKRFRQTGKLSIHKKSHGNYNFLKEASLLTQLGASFTSIANELSGNNHFDMSATTTTGKATQECIGDERDLLHRYVQSQEFSTLSAKIFHLPLPNKFFDYCAMAEKISATATTVPTTLNHVTYTDSCANSVYHHRPSSTFNNQLKSWQL